MGDSTTSEQKPLRQLPISVAGLAYLVLVVLCVFLWSPDIFATLTNGGATMAVTGHAAVIRIALVNGGFALLGALAAAGFGATILSLSRVEVSDRLTYWVIATALGLGLCALVILGLGLLGLIRPITAWCLVVAGLILFIVQIRTDIRPVPGTINRTALLWWLPTALPLALALTVAAFEPGLIWGEEGNGYDVLEYHLGGPKEYLEAVRIEYLPHNVYTNFPFNVEMLYLWMMLLRGDAVAGALTAKMLNVMMAVLAVLMMRGIGRLVAPNVGHHAAILFASLPFLVYLCGVAYVENGMLLFSATAIYCYLHGIKDCKLSLHWWVLAGVLVGWACGCKYPTVPMLALPVAFVGVMHLTLRKVKLSAFVCLTIAMVLAFAPWLLKNYAATGNPVFPLAHNVFDSHPPGWNADSAARWQAGHAVPEAAHPLTKRFARLGDQVLLSWKQGALISLGILSTLGLAFFSLFANRRKTNGDDHAQAAGNITSPTIHLCALLVVGNLYVWLFHTHLVDRFAVGLIIPAVLMLSIFLNLPQWHVLARTRPLVIWIVFVINILATLRYFEKNQVPLLVRNGLDNGSMLREYFTPHYEVINNVAKPNAKVLLVGDARTFYYNAHVDYCVTFNQNPFADAAANLSPSALMQWLRERDYEFVCVDWVEMRRLRQTYGFWPALTPELFRQLQATGLTAVQSFQSPVVPNSPPYATLFKVNGDQ